MDKLKIINEERKIIYEGLILFLPIQEHVMLTRAKERFKQDDICPQRRKIIRKMVILEIAEKLCQVYEGKIVWEGNEFYPLPKEVAILMGIGLDNRYWFEYTM